MEALLFAPVNGGCHLSDKTFGRHFKLALATIGRDGVTVHMLRHFAGIQTARVANLVETMGAGWDTRLSGRRCVISKSCPVATLRSPKRCRA